MGFLDILKRNKSEESIGMTPMPDSTDSLKNNLNAEDGLPPISDVPLPPKPSENVHNDDFPEVPKPENFSNIEDPIANVPNPMDSDSLNDEAITESIDLPDDLTEPTDSKTTADIAEPKNDFEDFELPDFSEEELKMSEGLKDFDNEEIKPEEDKTPNVDWSKIEPDSVDSDIPLYDNKKESPKTIVDDDDTVNIKPVVKEEPSENKKKDSFVNIKICFNIFENLDMGHEILKETDKSMEKEETKKDNSSELYKTFHDSLDTAQEKLMQIDSILFER